jgi:hypothetical protein
VAKIREQARGSDPSDARIEPISPGDSWLRHGDGQATDEESEWGRNRGVSPAIAWRGHATHRRQRFLLGGRADWVGSLPAPVPVITLASNLRVTGTQMEHMPFYLRTFFRLLSSWVHWGVCS